VLITGEIDRVTGFEKGFSIHQAWRGAGWEPDPLILDDQALIANVANRGLVILTGCGHAGVINICRYAQRLTGVARLHAVIGGLHLTGRYSSPSSPTHRQRARAARTRRDRPRPLHWLAGDARDRAPPARRVHPE